VIFRVYVDLPEGNDHIGFFRARGRVHNQPKKTTKLVHTSPPMGITLVSWDTAFDISNTHKVVRAVSDSLRW